MGEVIRICDLERTEFTWAEANAMLPLVKRIFNRHEKIINKLMSNQRFFISSCAPQHVITLCDNQVSEEMRQLGLKLHKLGLKALGNGYVGFDSGVFYWSFNGQIDADLNHYHAYNENPSLRREIKVLYPQVMK